MGLAKPAYCPPAWRPVRKCPLQVLRCSSGSHCLGSHCQILSAEGKLNGEHECVENSFIYKHDPQVSGRDSDSWLPVTVGHTVPCVGAKTLPGSKDELRGDQAPARDPARPGCVQAAGTSLFSGRMGGLPEVQPASPTCLTELEEPSFPEFPM